jgi:hypothetical protein
VDFSLPAILVAARFSLPRVSLQRVSLKARFSLPRVCRCRATLVAARLVETAFLVAARFPLPRVSLQRVSLKRVSRCRAFLVPSGTRVWAAASGAITGCLRYRKQ